MQRESLDWLREIPKAFARTIGVLLPGVIFGYVVVTAESLTLGHALELLGIAAVLTLAGTGFICMDRDVYREHGRLALFVFTTWASSSVVFRIMSYLHITTADERLLGNTISAIVLSVLLHWVLWLNKVVKLLRSFLTEKELN